MAEKSSRVSRAVMELRNFCSKLGGRFVAESNDSAVCVLETPVELTMVRIAPLLERPAERYLEIYPTRAVGHMELQVSDVDAEVYIHGSALEENHTTMIHKEGGLVNGRIIANEIKVTDRYGKLRVDIMRW